MDDPDKKERKPMPEQLKMSLRCAFLVIVALILSACSLSPDYARPTLDLPLTYEQAAAADPELDRAPDRRWWEGFSSEALIALQQRALSNSHSFHADRYVLAQSLARARQARAALLPSIDASGSASRGGRGERGGYQVNDTFSGMVQASYEVDIWGKNYDGNRAAAYQAIAGLNAWRGAGLSLESEVALTYFSFLAARENLRVYDDTLKNAREVLTYQETRERLGAAPPLDVARQRSSVAAMEAGRISYLVNMNEARNSLCLLIGEAEIPTDVAALMDGERLGDLLPPAIESGIPSDLLLRRPDVAQAEANLMAANANIGVARAAFLPGISLSAGAGWQSDSLSSLVSPASALYSLAASILQPIFQGGRLRYQYEETLAAHGELVERYRETVLSGFLEVATALDSNRLLQDQERYRQEAAREATEAYRIARLRYEAGAEDFLAVLDAQDAVLSTDNQLVQSRLERLNTVVTLFKALGGGWGHEPSPL